ncbi:uncharacterized protein ATC70_012656 [Mucor velutinosus]|uniref:F-box domain-containing protein n=1 Tax=Mucor velutinosus TaxID=708070 RepID=A0AAN7D5R1_9FUNG|nr:hypothetical protein ATC70_012656 [Mucor velutinosus]
MRDLPVEILIKVFGHLSRSNKLQCAIVCKSWCATALSVLNNTIHLRNTNDTIILFEKLCQRNSSVQGSTIRHLSLSHNSRLAEAQINRVVFLRILSECTNLRTLEFKDATFDTAYLEYMIRYRNTLHLDSLQYINGQYSNINSYLLVNWHYHQRINRLHLLVLNSTFNGFEYANSLNSYLDHFKALTTLSLKFSCTIYIHSLLSACPQLASLQLIFASSSSRLRIYEDKTTIQQNNGPFQLIYLDMSAHHISQELFEYLHDRASDLFELTVNHSAFENLAAIDNAFNTALVVDTVLPIRRIIFADGFNVSRSVVLGLNENFRNLRVIVFHSCGLNRIVDNNSNLTLNLSELELDYLSIDFTTILSFNTQVNSMSVAIEAQNSEDTVFYSRTSKWSRAHLFTRNDTSRYTSHAAQRNRVRSAKISVITVQVYSLHHLHMHGEGNHKIFSQTICLD